MTQGGPDDSTHFYALYLFNRAWRYLDMGYASAMAWILFVIVMAFTIVIFRTHSRWVHYGN
jgi:multiple sugar transport system permease protein